MTTELVLLSLLRVTTLLLLVANATTLYALVHRTDNASGPVSSAADKATWIVGIWFSLFALSMGWLT